jgi:hypothetical protein
MNNNTRKKRKSPAQVALDTLMRKQEPATAGTLFIDQTGRPAVMFWSGCRWQIEYVDSHQLTDQLCRVYFERIGTPISSKAVAEAQSLARATAISAHKQHEVYVRLAGSSNTILHDLCNGAGQIAQIMAHGYDLVTGRRIPFVRPLGLVELPTADSGDSQSLFELFHVLFPFLRDEYLALLASWVVAAMNGRGPYPVLGLFGPRGCTKSTITQVLRDLIDPQATNLSSLPKDERDLFISASNSYILAFDNVSIIPPGLSDALCRIASGGGYRTRKLYSDREEALFDVQRPIIINGIANVITRDDLRDRSLILTLPEIAESARVTEAQFWDCYRRLQPGILDALYRCVSAALCNVKTTQLATLPRMADSYQWVKAAEPEIGLPAGLLDKALQLNREESLEAILDSSVVARELIGMVTDEQQCQGTATELLDRLRSRTEQNAYSCPKLPQTAHDLSTEITRLAPALREVGISIRRGRRSGGNRERLIVLRRETGG